MSVEYISPETGEAVRTAGQIAFALEDEFHPLDWETRTELARDIRGVIAESEGQTRRVAASVEFILESEIADLSDWEERLAAANLCRAVQAGLRAGN